MPSVELSPSPFRTYFGNWANILPPEKMVLGLRLQEQARAERDAGSVIYPSDEDVFRALLLTPPERVMAVILGQDPYHGPGQANGLAFSVSPGVKIPPSLRNIFKELKSDLNLAPPLDAGGKPCGDLTCWAEHGVLLLNTVLTVEGGKANSHRLRGWQEFTSSVVQVCMGLPQPIVFILWGGQARAACAYPDSLYAGTKNKDKIWSTHPSPLSAHRGDDSFPCFLGSRPFSRANRFLALMGSEEVNWALDRCEADSI